MLDEGTAQSLTGIGTIFHGIGALRNSSGTAHGKTKATHLPAQILRN
ncbi:abortive infection family protein [Pseudomonas taiwanensis]